MKILAANRLIDGIAVWLGPDGKWVEDIRDADVVRDSAGEEQLLATAGEAFGNNLIVDPELIEVDLINGEVIPRRLRERIRAAGPSIHPNLGKQATRNAVVLMT